MEEFENQPLPQEVEHALDEIDRILHQMLLLAELSASDSNVDRQSLQKVLERLQSKIDAIADRTAQKGAVLCHCRKKSAIPWPTPWHGMNQSVLS